MNAVTDKQNLNWPQVLCCGPAEPPCNGACICGPDERPLRAYAEGRVTTPMTPAQREFCLSEIDQVEGHSRQDHETDSDRNLAIATLGAWQDYCQDKGLL